MMSVWIVYLLGLYVGIFVCRGFMNRQTTCHIPQDRSGKAIPGESPIRISSSPIAPMEAWNTELLFVEDINMKMNCEYLVIILKSQDIGSVNTELCYTVFNTHIEYETLTEISLWSVVETLRFGQCENVSPDLLPSHWAGKFDLVFRVSVPWSLLIPPDTLINLVVDGEILMHFNVTMLGCPVGYYGQYCNHTCVCPLHSQDCHSLYGNCLSPKISSVPISSTIATKFKSSEISHPPKIAITPVFPSSQSTVTKTSTKDQNTTPSNGALKTDSLLRGVFMLFCIHFSRNIFWE